MKASEPKRGIQIHKIFKGKQYSLLLKWNLTRVTKLGIQDCPFMNLKSTKGDSKSYVYDLFMNLFMLCA